ncbi:myotubularin-related protein 10-A-like [Scyliorhinus torazame]|uniref:myotubularin-related protein 10-A-like n=1 Tax=Scyliorhinus torazame TaxID=75743 RepID=UPI003B5A68F5
MAIHDSTHILLFRTFLFNCPRERAYIQQTLATDRRTRSNLFSNGWPRTRSTVRGEQVVLKAGFFTREESSCPLPPVWDWSLQFPTKHQRLFRNALYSDTQLLAQNGTSVHSNTEQADAPSLRSVHLLSKGLLLVPAQLLPWKGASVAKKLSRLSQSLESLLEMEQPQRIPLPPFLDPVGLPFPPIPAPGLRLWKSCYLRWLSAGVQRKARDGQIAALASQIQSLERRLRGEADGRNAAPNGLDRQGNQIPHRPNAPIPACLSETATMETSFSTSVSKAVL